MEAVVTEVRRRLLDHDRRIGGTLAIDYPKTKVRKLIEDGLRRLNVKDKEVSQENRQIILSSFGSLRQTTMRAGAVLAQKPSGLSILKTSEMGVVRERLSGITSTLAIFYDADSEKLGTSDDAAALRKAEYISRGSVPTFLREVSNSYLFKSPVNVALTSHTPERDFAERLLNPRNAPAIKSWVKPPDVGFYKIEYSYQGTGGGTKRAAFNPDYFILLKNGDIVVVETKADDDSSPMNAGKLKYATDHFKAVNDLLAKKGEKRRYYFHFVSPVDYNRFFEALRNRKIDSFVSTLQAALKP